jgi:hypothetical protein
MRVVGKGLVDFNTVDLKLLNLESELSFLSFLNSVAVHILLKCVNVFRNSVWVLLDIAVRFEPEIVRLAENN